jgi:hypothetical protein
MRAPAKRQTVKLTTWVKPSVKREFQRIAEAEHLSLSRTGAVALEQWIATRLDMQYAGMLEPIILRALAKGMRAYSSRIAMLLVRSMFTSEQTRALVTNILARQPGMTQPVLDTILNGTSNTAKGNIRRITPQLATLLREVEQWLEQGTSTAHD